MADKNWFQRNYERRGWVYRFMVHFGQPRETEAWIIRMGLKEGALDRSKGWPWFDWTKPSPNGRGWKFPRDTELFRRAYDRGYYRSDYGWQGQPIFQYDDQKEKRGGWGLERLTAAHPVAMSKIVDDERSEGGH